MAPQDPSSAPPPPTATAAPETDDGNDDAKREFFAEAPQLRAILGHTGITGRSESWEIDLGALNHCFSVDARDDDSSVAGEFVALLRQLGFEIDTTMMTGEKENAAALMLLRPGQSILSVCHDHDHNMEAPDAFDPFLDAAPALRTVREFVEANAVRLMTVSLDWSAADGVSAHATGTFAGEECDAITQWLEGHGFAIAREDAGLGRRRGAMGTSGGARIGKRRDDWDLWVVPRTAELPWTD